MARPKKEAEFDEAKSREFFDRMYNYIMENEEEMFMNGALLHVSKEDGQRYHPNFATNLIAKFKNSEDSSFGREKAKERRELGSELQSVYDHMKMIVEYRIAKSAIMRESGVYANFAQFVLMQHGWNFSKKVDTTVSSTGKIEIISEGEDPEVS